MSDSNVLESPLIMDYTQCIYIIYSILLISRGIVYQKPVLSISKASDWPRRLTDILWCCSQPLVRLRPDGRGGHGEGGGALEAGPCPAHLCGER